VIDKGKILAIAQKYVLKGQSRKAIKEYLKLVETNPDDKRLHLKLGDLYLKEGDNKKAFGEYLKVAQLYAEEDLNPSAISIYKKVLSIDPKSVEAHHELAKLYVKEGLIGSAKTSYQKILQIDPGNHDAHKAMEKLGERQLFSAPPPDLLQSEPLLPDPQVLPAETPAENASAQPPSGSLESPGLVEGVSPDKDSQMHYHLGIAYKEMELFDLAITEFELACSDLGMKFDCCIMLGNCFMDKGDYDKSIEAFRNAMDIVGLPDEKIARLQYNLGLAYEAKGLIEEAIDTFNLALKSDHLIPEARERLKKLQQE
jgi:tetratricopeptide (TPR) repeat protein